MSSVLDCGALRESLPREQILSAGTDEQRDSAAEKAEVSHSSEVEGPAPAANRPPFENFESQLAAYKRFCELWDSGEIAQADHADGFEILFRVHAPSAGRVTLLFKAESDAQIFEHFASWRAQFGIEMDFAPVIGCQDVVDYHKK